MTRETRIGLLVGLGFIITFGLILTELTGGDKPATEPASLSDPVELALTPAEDISPAVVHAQDVPPRMGAPAAALMAAGQDAPAQAGTAAESPAAEVVAVVRSGSNILSPAAGRPAALVAQGSPRITSAAELEAPPAVVPVVSPAPVAAATLARTYVVQPGDSLVKIARKVYGDDARDGYKRVLEANCDKITDPSLIRVGQVLVIPEPAGAVRAVAAGSPNVREVELGQLADVLASAAESPEQAGPRTVYVIQRGDTLTKIARETLNDGSRAAVMSIFNANQSKLSDPDRLPVGAELVIPG